MWIHEVCRVVLDRFSEQSRRNELFKDIKFVASEAFKIKEKLFTNKVDNVMFCYGTPEGKYLYRPIPEQE